jgi:hypothetical protein
MAFAAGELLGSIVAVRAAALGRLDRLAAYDRCVGGGVAPEWLS